MEDHRSSCLYVVSYHRLLQLVALCIETASVKQIILCPAGPPCHMGIFERFFDEHKFNIAKTKQVRVVCPKHMHRSFASFVRKFPKITVTADRAKNPFLSLADHEFIDFASRKKHKKTAFGHWTQSTQPRCRGPHCRKTPKMPRGLRYPYRRK